MTPATLARSLAPTPAVVSLGSLALGLLLPIVGLAVPTASG
jgi:hypothetical protein